MWLPASSRSIGLFPFKCTQRRAISLPYSLKLNYILVRSFRIYIFIVVSHLENVILDNTPHYYTWCGDPESVSQCASLILCRKLPLVVWITGGFSLVETSLYPYTIIALTNTNTIVTLFVSEWRNNFDRLIEIIYFTSFMLILK